MAIKQSWHDKVQKSPQLSHIILNRCTSQEQTIPTIKAEKRFPSYTVDKKKFNPLEMRIYEEEF